MLTNKKVQPPKVEPKKVEPKKVQPFILSTFYLIPSLNYLVRFWVEVARYFTR